MFQADNVFLKLLAVQRRGQAQQNHTTTRKRADLTPKSAFAQISVPEAGTSPRAVLGDTKPAPAHPLSLIGVNSISPSQEKPNSALCDPLVLPDPKQHFPAFSHPWAQPHPKYPQIPQTPRGEPRFWQQSVD